MNNDKRANGLLDLAGKVVRKFLRIIGPSHAPAPDYAKYVLNKGSEILAGFDLRIEIPSDRTFVTLGVDSVVQCGLVFESSEGTITIGDRTHIGTAKLICRSKIVIGDDVYIAWGVTLYDHNSHSIDLQERKKDSQRELEAIRAAVNPYVSKDWTHVKAEPIFIGNGAWIGMNVLILKGVNIGEGAVVGAGSVVTRDVEPWTVVGGNPARLIKRLQPQ